ncbi:hypothetical protein V6N13_113802 [Hibiscus sabdariffa]|uniref:C2H2-type domain-containing protein n=1 Tax=Hibiscus sabdariffa TaxID=183260 RepID=A0ABR2U0P7_9ROSI
MLIASDPNFTPLHLVELNSISGKIIKTPKSTGGAYGSASSNRPYEGCEKAYIHEYKLKLHLRREHPYGGTGKTMKRMARRQTRADLHTIE